MRKEDKVIRSMIRSALRTLVAYAGIILWIQTGCIVLGKDVVTFTWWQYFIIAGLPAMLYNHIVRKEEIKIQYTSIVTDVLKSLLMSKQQLEEKMDTLTKQLTELTQQLEATKADVALVQLTCTSVDKKKQSY